MAKLKLATTDGTDTVLDDRIVEGFGARKCDRLGELKRKYDTTNLFRLNQNIKP